MGTVSLGTCRTEPSVTCLEWDSAFWGFPVGRVVGQTFGEREVASLDRWCREHPRGCVFWLASSADAASARVAEAAGFRLVDVRMTFEWRLAGPSDGATRPRSFGRAMIRPATPEDVPALAAAARSLHRDTRFYVDGRFPFDRCDELYATWIANSCAGYADQVLVAEWKGRPVGYITCHRDPPAEGGRIGLVGVSPEGQGRGIGGDLVQAALAWFASHSTRVVEVTTQGRNIAAQRLYQRYGFLTRDVTLWYHRWSSPETVSG